MCAALVPSMAATTATTMTTTGGDALSSISLPSGGMMPGSAQRWRCALIPLCVTPPAAPSRDGRTEGTRNGEGDGIVDVPE